MIYHAYLSPQVRFDVLENHHKGAGAGPQACQTAFFGQGVRNRCRPERLVSEQR